MPFQQILNTIFSKFSWEACPRTPQEGLKKLFSTPRGSKIFRRIDFPQKQKILDRTLMTFHNLQGYDSHFIMQQIGEITKNHAYKNKKGEEEHLKINAIPSNTEKYMAFMLGNHPNFIDSFQFMSSSLDKLVTNLPKDAFNPILPGGVGGEEVFGTTLELFCP